MSWSITEHHNVADSGLKKRVDGLKYMRPAVDCPRCGAHFEPSLKVKAGYCKHLVAFFDVDFSPCDCPATHIYVGIACRTVVRAAVTEPSESTKYFQCLSCKVRWRTITRRGEADRITHVYKKDEELL